MIIDFIREGSVGESWDVDDARLRKRDSGDVRRPRKVRIPRCYKFPLYVTSVSRCLQLRPMLEFVVVSTFWLHRGTSAAKARKLSMRTKSLRDGSLAVTLEARAPTPMAWPNTLSQLAHIFKPIQLSTGPRTGKLPKRYFAPSNDNMYPVN